MTTSLSDQMEFDHVIEVHADGTITDATGQHAPELTDDDLMGDGWTLLDGYSGQHGYRGPVMHPSEFIGGRMEDHIRTTPGYYVAIAAYYTDDSDGVVDDVSSPEGWAVAFKPVPEMSEHYADNMYT